MFATSAPARWLMALCLASAATGLLPAPVAAATLSGSGTSASEDRAVGEFQAIALRGSIDLEVRQGPAIAVRVQADDNLLPLLETVVEPGATGPVLQVRWKGGQSLSIRSKARVSVTMPALSAIAGAGAGVIRLEAFSTPRLKLALSGSGNATLDGLQADELTLAIAGSGDVKGSGRVARLAIGISGSGDVKLGEMRADDVSVRIAGSGDAEVNAQKALQVSIAGSGDVVYSGEAALKSSVAGSGTVRKR